ncbi:MAG: hypothetical protein C0502_08580 [Opitutus sp.]|nr:hypothetical protein [Opitutus sp.]
MQAGAAAAFVRGVSIAVVSWFWKGLRGHSITFAALFASFVIGGSFADLIRLALARLGVHWLFVFVLPILFFGWLSGQEARWLPDERRRKTIARSLLFGSIALAIAINRIRH